MRGPLNSKVTAECSLRLRQMDGAHACAANTNGPNPRRKTLSVYVLVLMFT